MCGLGLIVRVLASLTVILYQNSASNGGINEVPTPTTGQIGCLPRPLGKEGEI